MKQLTQKLKNGKMKVLEVPAPTLNSGCLLVQPHYSVISGGTEGGTVRAARKSLLGKAKERPQQVKQVIDTLKQQGPVQTYRAVMKKLDSYSPLGYSAAGEVIDVASDVEGFAVGDLVACAGAGFANHAEIIAVPVNLCVKLPLTADLSKAAYNTLGAIALQGVRQADLKLGECCVVIGLGLLGQLSSLLLKASGARVVGIDINPKMVSIASQHCVDLGLVSGTPGLVERIDEFTDGIGADAVIIAAATDSLEPINSAGRLLRKRGTVIIVGSVPTGFDREPYYRKEITLKMSCSYGPGRYDIKYEEQGIDYPSAYVRWTENRNMKAFQDMIHSGRINIDYLTTHRFKLDDSPLAYELILNRDELFLGIIIDYGLKKPVSTKRVEVEQPQVSHEHSGLKVAFIGAGSYAMSHLLPNVRKDDRVVLTGVMTSSGTSSRSVAEKYGFEFCTSSEDEIVKNTNSDAVFIATRHDSHAHYVKMALLEGKHVFVEKPLCLSRAELDDLVTTHELTEKEHGAKILMVGFNRRFSPLAREIKNLVGQGPMSMLYRVNAGHIPEDSWIQDRHLGGGRIVGEVCHFVDFLIFLNGSLPKSIFAVAMSDPKDIGDTINVSLHFDNGSIGTISYFANGSKNLP
jgi:threonine dehydrogenase-like Zn-dependent dehydrogenase